MKKLCTVLGLIAVTALLTATSVSIADASIKPPDFKNKGQCIETSGSEANDFCDQFKPICDRRDICVIP
jgi:hypothetical protein